ncbi:CYFA0S09e03950g1_1 [Cyberlindnera fabianii]|uniref:CYFA0S09e03950g1_1 n=1 Tax=Cyberlindnera fabianii TaxID=36022 RepID=A0A061B612_CYBFA|nr:CYFA0S09e03950g1_1 [Cyberlindnera fabianii]
MTDVGPPADPSELKTIPQEPKTSENPGAPQEEDLSDTGKTSPLTDLSSPSPPYFKDEPLNGPADNTEDTNPTTRDSNDEFKRLSESPFQEGHSNLERSTEQATDARGRTKSVASYESSDLSDLDSEAETEKMFSPNGTPKQSQLAKLAKSKNEFSSVDEVVRLRLDDKGHKTEDTSLLNSEGNDDNTLIKDDVLSELEHSKESDVEAETSTDAIKRLVNHNGKRKAADRSTSRASPSTAKSSNGELSAPNGKRKLEEDSDESLKRRKTKQSDDGDDDTAAPEASLEQEAENEGEDDGDEEEPEEEDEEEELTEEQKQKKLVEAEAELEKQKMRKEAIQSLTEIEIDFAKLRDRLYEDKMARFKSELEMCLSGTHPELQSVYTKIDSHREEKVRLSSLNQKYRLECIHRQIRAQRTAVHQQYYKKVSDHRAARINQIMHKWDQLHIERRLVELQDYPRWQYRVPEYVDEVVTQRAQKNQEISNLVGLSIYHGFPTAPAIPAATSEELDNDLLAMNIAPSKT